MQKLQQPKAKLFYFLVQLENKGVLSTTDKGLLKDEIIKDNAILLNAITIDKLKQRELKKKLLEILVQVKNANDKRNEKPKAINFDSKIQAQVVNKLKLLEKQSPISSQFYEKKLDNQNQINSVSSSPISLQNSKKKKRPFQQLKIPENRKMEYYQGQIEEKVKDNKLVKCQSMQLKQLIEQDIVQGLDKGKISKFEQTAKEKTFTYFAQQTASTDYMANIKQIQQNNFQNFEKIQIINDNKNEQFDEKIQEKEEKDDDSNKIQENC